MTHTPSPKPCCVLLLNLIIFVFNPGPHRILGNGNMPKSTGNWGSRLLHFLWQGQNALSRMSQHGPNLHVVRRGVQAAGGGGRWSVKLGNDNESRPPNLDHVPGQ